MGRANARVQHGRPNVSDHPSVCLLPGRAASNGAVPRFEPFRGVRYDTTRAPAVDVTAPPYDVISPADRAALVLRHQDNVVQIDLPDEADGPGRYTAAAATFQQWLGSGV